MHTARNLLGGRVAQAILAAVLVSAVTWLALMLRPADYVARVGLLGSIAPASSSQDFPGVVAQSMAAIVDVAHSPSVLSNASSAVPGAPGPDELYDAVSVDVVPSSGLARLSVRASSPNIARQLVIIIAQQIANKELIAPVGVFRVLDDQPDIRKATPDGTLAAGLALAAGAAAAVAVLGLNALIRPSRRQKIERAIASAGITRPVAIIGTATNNALSEIRMLSAVSARPVRVVAMTPSTGPYADALTQELVSSGLRVADGRDNEEASVVGVAADGDDSESLSCALAALPERGQLIAVVLAQPQRRIPAAQ